MTYSYESYHYYKDHGICVDCHQNEAAKGKTRCLNCLSIRAEQDRKRKSKLTAEEIAEKNRIKREKGQALRDYRKANGLCDVCGKPVYKNYSKCYEHYIYYLRYERKRRQEKKNKGYAELGLCRICGKPTVEGKKFCAEHLEQYRENIRKANEIRLEKKRMAKTYCRNDDCPFKECERHMDRLKGKKGVYTFASFEGTCKRYIAWLVGKVAREGV